MSSRNNRPVQASTAGPRRSWLPILYAALLLACVPGRALADPAAADPASAKPASAKPASASPAPASRETADPARAAGLRSIVVLDFDLIDEQDNPLTRDVQQTRLRDARLQLQGELAQRGLYRVADAAPAADLQRRLRSQQAFMHRCDDCASQIGQLLGVDLVMQTWVQKVSELILNLNVQIYDVKAGKPVLTKSVDMRGNDDVSWTRAVRFLVRDMAEKRERNPNYGL